MLQQVFFGGLLGVAAWYALFHIHAPVSAQRSLFKTLPVSGLGLLAIWLGGPWLLVAALFLSALGDYFLSLDDRHFVSGLLAFLCGHFAYIALFYRLGAADNGIGIPALAALGLYSGVFAVFLWNRSGRHRFAVLAYIVVISVMAAMSLSLGPGYGLVTAGAFVFVLSDSLLAIRMFVLLASSKYARLFSMLVWWTYISAQFTLLIGLVKLV